MVMHVVIPAFSRAVNTIYTGHILSGKSYKAEELVTFSSLFYDMKCGLVTWTNILIIF